MLQKKEKHEPRKKEAKKQESGRKKISCSLQGLNRQYLNETRKKKENRNLEKRKEERLQPAGA